MKAALDARSRDIRVVYMVQKKRQDRRALELQRLARAAGARVERVDRRSIDEMAVGGTHGGIVAEAGPRRFSSLEQLVSGVPRPFVVMLDGIEDPYRLGHAIRALYGAGVDGVVMRPRNWTSATATVVRASAGASELMPTALAETPQQAAEFFRAKGLTVCTTARRADAVSLHEADLSVPLFMLIGGERRGIQRSFVEQADLLLAIPYGRAFDLSLGTVAATAVIAFEVMRQRNLAR
ncbi:MAG: RNA methyltransferase [Planctomycetes bacterium]|nr:RNA methyltransferase [Planctomycetota bacterium]